MTFADIYKVFDLALRISFLFCQVFFTIIDDYESRIRIEVSNQRVFLHLLDNV